MTVIDIEDSGLGKFLGKGDSSIVNYRFEKEPSLQTLRNGCSTWSAVGRYLIGQCRMSLALGVELTSPTAADSHSL
jgi:hypothetical protein